VEQINKVALRSLVNNEASTQLVKPPENSGVLFLAMTQMRANFPNQELTPETAELWMASWTSLTSEFGLARFQRALTNLLTRAKFFPLPAEIREEIENGLEQEREQRSLERGRARIAEVEGWRRTWLAERSAEAGMTVEEFLADQKAKERSRREAEDAEAKKKQEAYRDLVARQAKRAQERLDAERQRRQAEDMAKDHTSWPVQ
jgi:hypothetical protein